MTQLKLFRQTNGLTQKELADYLGIGVSFISRVESGQVELPQKHLSKLLINNNGWETSSLTLKEQGSNINGSVIVGGNASHSTIDNRQYFSDSPDVLRAQIDMLDERIKEKDAQIKEKDAQIKEKDAQIKQLLDIIQGRNATN